MRNEKTLDDNELVVKIRTKDKQLYAQIVNRYEVKLLRYVIYLIHDENMAADVVQNTFIKAYINLNAFDTKKKFSSWIYRISHNEAMNAIKKYHKEVKMNEDFDLVSDTDPNEEFSKNEIKKMVNYCLETMPVIYSEVLVLYYLEDKSYEEIGYILRIPVGTVGTRINRGKALMKKLCKNRN
jgi:RNA polymerase sigma-70 factor, ECF subfamily